MGLGTRNSGPPADIQSADRSSASTPLCPHLTCRDGPPPAQPTPTAHLESPSASCWTSKDEMPCWARTFSSGVVEERGAR